MGLERAVTVRPIVAENAHGCDYPVNSRTAPACRKAIALVRGSPFNRTITGLVIDTICRLPVLLFMLEIGKYHLFLR